MTMKPGRDLILAAATVCFGVSTAQDSQARAVISGFKSCDALLAAGLEGRVSFPGAQAYNSSLEEYYTVTTQELKPWCIVQPQSAREVSQTLQALSGVSSAGNWGVAIRSGGHSMDPYANNIANGVTIDLGFLNATVVDHARKMVSIGTGSRWKDVYATVEPLGLMVNGGRTGDVGVGGFLLGGGITFYSARRGLGCDDVVNFEVVLANGTIVDANSNKNPDLFKALKGGGNNLGIVTRFDVNAWETGLVYGGLSTMLYSQRDVAFKQFVRMVDLSMVNTGDAQILSLVKQKSSSDISMVVITANVDGVENSTSLSPLNDIAMASDLRKHQTVGAIAASYDEGHGNGRDFWWTLTFHNNLDMLDKMAAIFEQLVSDLSDLVPSEELQISWVIQPFSAQLGAHGLAKGGNVLGLDQSLRNSSIMLFAQTRTGTVEQERVAYTKVAAAIGQLSTYAVSRGAHVPFIYANYASAEQDPLGTYNEDNISYLKKVARQYDPEAFFQNKVLGGFKIFKV